MAAIGIFTVGLWAGFILCLLFVGMASTWKRAEAAYHNLPEQIAYPKG